ncbi:hypothetical protein AQUCO_01000381v1 [Aquilegia coerulea]|uniref:FBD domain-containing protein n=1 Tax=Aquilegia coerulea TaxID=218851 RepID=A0A2G5E9N4_AQUCA|nr:hypothetical protein AQUCO_01000381v1 [Aquilegia coerulea]
MYNLGLTERVRLDDVVRGLDGLQVLGIAQPFLELLPMDVEPKRLDITYYHLKDISLEVNFEDLKQILAVLCLCRSSPHLKTINIEAVWDKESTFLCDEDIWIARLNKEEDIFNHLETVSLSGFKGTKNDLGFSQFILLNARDLMTFYIDWEESALMPEKLAVVEMMMQFHRASTIAEVIFKSKV